MKGWSIDETKSEAALHKLKDGEMLAVGFPVSEKAVLVYYEYPNGSKIKSEARVYVLNKDRAKLEFISVNGSNARILTTCYHECQSSSDCGEFRLCYEYCCDVKLDECSLCCVSCIGQMLFRAESWMSVLPYGVLPRLFKSIWVQSMGKHVYRLSKCVSRKERIDMPTGKLIYIAFAYLLFSLITIYGSLSSGRSTLDIIRSLVALWIWLTPSFIVMHYSSKLLSPTIGKKITEDVAVILGLIVLLLTYVVVYYLSFLIGPVLLVSQDKSLFESMKPLVAGVVSMILIDIAHIIYVEKIMNSTDQDKV